jgi:FkbM family methyltransferase
MVIIEQIDRPSAPPALGRESRFIAGGEPLATVDYFLEHDGVFYPAPLPREPDGCVRIYPEAPGRYALHAVWRSDRGAKGRTRRDFAVDGPTGVAPQRAKAERETLWVPTAWDAQTLGAHERRVFAELQKIVRRGSVVYDVGANVGLFSMRFAQWVGADGWVYALEPNPVCVYFLRANLEQCGVRNATILPVAAARARGECEFTLNYGSSLIGVVGDSAAAWKPGHRIRVAQAPLDVLISELDLRPPDFVKIDVEGAEGSVVSGMMQTLRSARPGLLIELHGRDAGMESLKQLAELPYEYLLCSTGARYPTAEALLNSLPDECVQVLAFR